MSRQIRRHAHVFFSELGISNLALFFFTQRAIWRSWHQHLSMRISIRFGIGIGIAKVLFLPDDFFFKFTTQYSFLWLVIQHQYHFAAITYFSKLKIKLFLFCPFKGAHWCSVTHSGFKK